MDDRLLRRFQVLGDDLVVVDAVDGTHVLRRAPPHPVLRGFPTAVQLVEGQYYEDALFGTGIPDWPLREVHLVRVDDDDEVTSVDVGRTSDTPGGY
ncbi:hypothetical protein QF034_000185 [Streptomyces africanus]|uniref:Uncharacterized protein n=1 Tax=Streptomyces africanus TaxID=231024 RepID=A0ABU0QF05_9ACTN|nr:hypothetical protein [Streptomyces africanus]